MFINYFFAKVGYGNSLLPFAINKARNQDKAFFWVGYEDSAIPLVQGDSFKLKKNPDMRTRDLFYITLVAEHTAFRGTTRIVTFTEDKMQIWKILAPLRLINENELDELLAFTKSRKTVFLAFKVKKSKTNLDEMRVKLKGPVDQPGAKVLDVELETEVLRDLLPACMDSLSVFRYLNAGTFRPITAINAELVNTNIAPSFFKTKPVPVQLIPTIKTPTETRFALFVRKYFDWLRDSQNKLSFAETHQLSQDDIFNISISIMSPAQLETAASILAQSLGLTLDVGIGKGLDEIDVRCSIRHLRNTPDYRQKIETILGSLTSVMGGSIDPLIEQFFRDYGTAVIQCKNFQTARENYSHPHVILFTPGGALNGKEITISSVRSHLHKKPPSFAMLSDWLALVQFNYLQDKAVLFGKPL